MNVRELGHNVMSIAQIDTGAHGNGDIRRNVNGNVSGRSFKPGVDRGSAGFYQLYHDAASTGLDPRRGNAVEFDSAATSLGVHIAFSGCEVNAAAAGVNFSWTANVSQVNAAATGLRLHFARALTDLNAASTGLDAG